MIELCSNAYLYMYNCPNMQEVNPILSNLSILFILSKAILPAGAGTPHPGAIAPPVSLNDVEGYSHVLWQLKGRGGVLRFVFECSACREFGREWERVLRAGALKPIPQTIVIQSVTTSELGAFALEAALDSRIVGRLPFALGRLVEQHACLLSLASAGKSHNNHIARKARFP